MTTRARFAGLTKLQRIDGWLPSVLSYKPSGVTDIKPEKAGALELYFKGTFMRVGKVEWYSEKRGFGILSSPAADGALDKFYCHVSKIVRSPEKIEQGQRATFEVGTDPIRRPGDLRMAFNVVIELPQSQKTEVRSES